MIQRLMKAEEVTGAAAAAKHQKLLCHLQHVGLEVSDVKTGDFHPDVQ